MKSVIGVEPATSAEVRDRVAARFPDFDLSPSNLSNSLNTLFNAGQITRSGAHHRYKYKLATNQ